MKDTMKESTGKQILSVPNTREGRAFIEMFKSYLNNSQYKVHTRRRGSKKIKKVKKSSIAPHYPYRHPQYHMDTPKEQTVWLAIYVNPKVTPRSEFLDGYKNGEGAMSRLINYDLTQLVEKYKSY